MFIGEMACWLVVAGFSIYKCYLAKEASIFQGPYERVSDNEDGEVMDDEPANLRQSSSLSEFESPAVKALLPTADNRRVLAGRMLFLLALPACCDVTATTLMNVGLLFVAASIYQMTRGALVLFVGLFSILFLRRKLYLYQWSALVIVVLGVAIVGLAGAIGSNSSATQPYDSFTHRGLHLVRSSEANAVAHRPESVQTVLGVLMIAAAQIFTATQFVLEEWILENYALEPLKVVGWEGIFGLIMTVIGMIILHVRVGQTPAGKHGYFDVQGGWNDIVENKGIAITSILIMISIGGFNFFGLSVTRSVSATARSTIDTSRTLFIWMISLGLGWETFKWLQILGFALLVYGTFLFNDIIQPPLRACLRPRRHENLLPEESIEHL